MSQIIPGILYMNGRCENSLLQQTCFFAFLGPLTLSHYFRALLAIQNKINSHSI